MRAEAVQFEVPSAEVKVPRRTFHHTGATNASTTSAKSESTFALYPGDHFEVRNMTSPPSMFSTARPALRASQDPWRPTPGSNASD
jgi:hypothetical protein